MILQCKLKPEISPNFLNSISLNQARTRFTTLRSMLANFEEKLGDIDHLKIKDELGHFALVIKKTNKLFKNRKDFLNYIRMKHLMEVFPNLFITLKVLLMCPLSIAEADRSFNKLKLIETFNRSAMMDDRLSSWAIISTKSDCARS